MASQSDPMNFKLVTHFLNLFDDDIGQIFKTNITQQNWKQRAERQPAYLFDRQIKEHDDE